MSNLTKLIQSILTEVLKELAPEAPEDAPFGQYLFAPDRKDLAGEEKKNPTRMLRCILETPYSTTI